MWDSIAGALAIGLLAFILYRYVKAHPETLSRAALGKSMHTLGWLSLGLIALIAVCIMLLRA